MSSQNIIRFDELGFDNDKYIKLQTDSIHKRLEEFKTGRLYIEMGGKFNYDAHATRVLPGFLPDNKVRILKNLKHKFDLILSISSIDLSSNRQWTNAGISYSQFILDLLEKITKLGLPKPYICMNFYDGSKQSVNFLEKLNKLGYFTYKRYVIKNYPESIENILSKDGYDKDDYIDVKNKIVVVIAPGSNSGKMSICLGQIFKEEKMNQVSGFAKFETFPIWNLDLNHCVNIAYEAATADIGDYNEIDPYHKEAYKINSVNYNRDIQAFPILQSLARSLISSKNHINSYKSPTDMGINMAGFCITDDNLVRHRSKEEIIRRYFWLKDLYNQNKVKRPVVDRIQSLMNSIGLEVEYLDIVAESRRSNKIAFKKHQNAIALYTSLNEILKLYTSSDLFGTTLHSPHNLTQVEQNRLTELGVVYTNE